MQQILPASLFCNQSTSLNPPASRIPFNITILPKSRPSKISIHVRDFDKHSASINFQFHTLLVQRSFNPPLITRKITFGKR